MSGKVSQERLVFLTGNIIQKEQMSANCQKAFSVLSLNRAYCFSDKFNSRCPSPQTNILFWMIDVCIKSET